MPQNIIKDFDCEEQNRIFTSSQSCVLDCGTRDRCMIFTPNAGHLLGLYETSVNVTGAVCFSGIRVQRCYRGRDWSWTITSLMYRRKHNGFLSTIFFVGGNHSKQLIITIFTSCGISYYERLNFKILQLISNDISPMK